MTQKSQRTSFRILIATDNHIGFKEDHHIRGEDSFDAFEEILQVAKRNKVDFLLLGGDLFHELTPSPSCLYRSIRLLQKYVFGGGDLSYETKTLTGPYPANYLNENLNIDLPIFVIHGNHDHPMNAGENISSLDLLHASKLINYFGKYQNLDELTIEPILFEKGPVKIALYGMGHVKDTRLYYLFDKKKVHFVPPPGEEYMSILILHQNRFKGIRPGAPYKNCVHPTMLPTFLDLIIWGNEHESVDELVEDPVQNFYIYQPGSSIPTSLNGAEALQKHAGFFEIGEKKNFKFVPIALRNQRPLYVKNLELDQLVDSKKASVMQKLRMDDEAEGEEKKIEEKIEEEFNKIIEEHESNIANQKRLKNPPLIRLKVEYSGFDIIRIKQLELKFVGKVANEGDVLKFWRKTTAKQSIDIKKNKKLGVEFEDTLRQKISFETLTSESNDVIKGIFEDLVHNSKAKPKVLFAPDFLTQASNQKFTLQNVSNQINGSLDYAKKQLLTDKIRESQTMSKKIIQSETGYIQSQYSGGDTTIEEISNSLKEYEQHIHSIPKFLMTKLQEFSERRVPEEIMKEEDQEEDEEEAKGKKKKSAPKGKKGAAAAGGKKGGKEESKDAAKDDEDDEELVNGLQKMSMDKDYENSEDEEKEWFANDFGKGPETHKGRKNATKEPEKPKARAATRGKGKGKVSTSKDSEEEEEEPYMSESSELQIETTKKRGGGRKRNEPIVKDDDDEDEFDIEEEINPKLKKTKVAPSQNTTGKKPRGGKNKYFL